MKKFAVKKSIKSSLLLGGALWMGIHSMAYANEKIDSFEGIFSGVIVNEEVTDERGHVMEVEGTFHGISGVGNGRLKLFVEGKHAHSGDDHADENDRVTAECHNASGQGKINIRNMGVLKFSQAGLMCVKVQGIKSPKVHLFNGAYYVNSGTMKLAEYFGAGNISGSFAADPSVADPVDKRVIIRFNGAGGTKM